MVNAAPTGVIPSMTGHATRDGADGNGQSWSWELRAVNARGLDLRFRLPDGLGARIDLGAWDLPPVFRWLAETGGMAEAELLKTFNAGIGMVLVVEAGRAAELTALLSDAGETVHQLGTVVAGEGVGYTGALL